MTTSNGGLGRPPGQGPLYPRNAFTTFGNNPWGFIATPGGTLYTQFPGRVVNFMMWDEVFADFDVAFPPWKLLFATGVKIIEPPYLA